MAWLSDNSKIISGRSLLHYSVTQLMTTPQLHKFCNIFIVNLGSQLVSIAGWLTVLVVGDDFWFVLQNCMTAETFSSKINHTFTFKGLRIY